MRSFKIFAILLNLIVIVFLISHFLDYFSGTYGFESTFEMWGFLFTLLCNLIILIFGNPLGEGREFSKILLLILSYPKTLIERKMLEEQNKIQELKAVIIKKPPIS